MKNLFHFLLLSLAFININSAQIGTSCLSFDGVDDFAANFDFPYFGPVMTVECWVYVDAFDNPNGSDEPTFINRYSDEQYDPWFGLDGDTLSFWTMDDELLEGGIISIASWSHIAFSYDGTTSRMFLNGNIVATNTDDPTLDNSLAWFSLGAEVLEQNCPAAYDDDDIDYLFEGKIDEVRISDVARYTSSFTPTRTAFASDANTIALYHLDENAGQTAFDASSNGYDLTLGCSDTVDTNDPSWFVAANNIPTLGQWGVLIAMLLLTIVGSLYIREDRHLVY